MSIPQLVHRLLQNVAYVIVRYMNAAIDASSLIVLAKFNAIQEAIDVYGTLGITRSIEQETVHAGKIRGYAEAQRIEVAIVKGQIIVSEINNDIIKRATELRTSSTALSESDCHIIAFAAVKTLPLILQDRRARLAAEAIGVETISIVGLPLAVYIQTNAKYDRCIALLNQICKALSLDPAIQKALRAAIDEIKRLRKNNGG